LRNALVPCEAVWSLDSSLSKNLSREECCRGLPGDALCVPCNADPLSLSAFLHRTVYQVSIELVLPLLLPRDECCRGLPGDALCVPCNAGPLSLSAHPQSSTSQTTDTTMPSSSCAHSSLFATASQISHILIQYPSRDSEKLALMNLLREECRRGLPGDALCVPCNAAPLSLSATSLRMVLQFGPETMSVLLMPRDESCRGLPGDAPCVPCNAGPLSLSAYPQSSTSQTVDPDMLSSIQARTHLLATTCPTPSPTPFPTPLKDSLRLYHKTLSTHVHKVLPCITHSPLLSPPPASSMLSTSSALISLLEEGTTRDRCLPDSLSTKILPRDECCRGLPGDALCVPCNAGSLSLSAIPLRMVFQFGPVKTYVLLMPGDEYCWGLPGDALSVPCNAGPLSLSAYPQSSITQTVDSASSSSYFPSSPFIPGSLLSPGCPHPSHLHFGSAFSSDITSDGPLKRSSRRLRSISPPPQASVPNLDYKIRTSHSQTPHHSGPLLLRNHPHLRITLDEDHKRLYMESLQTTEEAQVDIWLRNTIIEHFPFDLSTPVREGYSDYCRTAATGYCSYIVLAQLHYIQHHPDRNTPPPKLFHSLTGNTPICPGPVKVPLSLCGRYDLHASRRRPSTLEPPTVRQPSLPVR
jgi:hypothetical protein